ncbi:11S globulin seed storage protein 2-like [Bidens hawaiensis]|uniref:11S globulin seed storage protein 2-like n=1 Tax=Bidens hawaiensis TaxID=980011 RepID=UPI00404B8FEE
MVAIKLIGVFLCLLGTTVIATSRLTSPEFCNLQQLTKKQPLQFLQFEGGSVEKYLNQNDEEFQCFGLNPERVTIQTESLSLPNFFPFPRLIFIKEVIISYLAGGVSSQHLQEQQGFFRPDQEGFFFKSTYAGFDRELLAESFNESPQVVSALQEPSNRGLIVKVQQPMRFVTPDEQQFSRGGIPANGLEEGRFCSSKLVFNLNSQREADIFSEQAGKLNLVNEHKLPILSHMDVSAEKGYLQPNALFSPHWTVNSHTLVYVLNGEAQVQVVSNNGQAVLDEQVNKGDIFFVPQFFATTARAGQNGFEWVAFKTNKSPLKSPVAGYTSVFRAMPLEVITNSYMVSPSQAQGLKINRQTESLLFSPISQRS